MGAAWRVEGLLELESFRQRLGDYSRIANIWARAGLGDFGWRGRHINNMEPGAAI